MQIDDHIIDISGVRNRAKFFAALLMYYAPIEVILTTWGKIPKDIHKNLKLFKAPSSLFRRHIFRESSWHLNNNSLSLIIENLCIDNILESFTWGILKNSEPLVLARSWIDINLNSSSFISDADIIKWLDNLVSNQIIENYEIVNN